MTPRVRAYSLALAAITLTFLAVNARWIWLFRHAMPLDIDEAGYLGLALVDYFGLREGGLPGWFAAVEQPSIQAPVTTAAASLLFAVAGPHPVAGFGVPLMAGAGCILATAAMARTCGSRRAAVMAALLTASCPLIVQNARTFNFSVPVTLVTALALLSALRSRGFRSLGWSAAFGVCLGLMPLTRTMTVAFVPGIVAAAALVALAGSGERVRRLLHLCGAGVLSVAVAATWLVPNGRLVADYLFSFGYGSRAAEYGHNTSRYGPQAWLDLARYTVNSEIYGVHAAILAMGVVLLLGAAITLLATTRWPDAGRRLLLSPLLPLAVFVTEACVMLASSANTGSAFFSPVVPPAMVLAAAGLDRLARLPAGRAVTFALVACAVLWPGAAMIDLRSPAAAELLTQVPWFGPVVLTKGRGVIQQYESNSGYGAPVAVQPLDDHDSRAWTALSGWTAARLIAQWGRRDIVLFGFRNALYNVNTVNLEVLLHAGFQLGMRQVEPTVTGNTVAGYRDWLLQDGGDACILLTSDRALGDFQPAVDRVAMAAAARAAGFVPNEAWPLPDGQTVTAWQHGSPPPNCQHPG